MITVGQKKILTFIIHFAVWGCFVVIPFIFQQHPKDNPLVPAFNVHFVAVCLSSSFYLITFYYFNTLYLIPKYLITQKWKLYIFIVSCFFISFLYLPELFSSLFNESLVVPPNKFSVPMPPPHQLIDSLNYIRPPRNHHGKRGFHFFPGSYLVFILVFTIGTCLSVVEQWLKTENNKKEIEREKLNTELLFLKSQVNPHFFFNTLNSIYSLALINHEDTASTILKLSDIMRYVISDSQLDTVPLVDEISFLKNFIDIQLVRVTDKVKVDFDVEGDTDDIMIAPLLFIPFIENAFKFGISTKESTIIIFKVVISGNKVLFTSNNTIIHSENSYTKNTGIGIVNVKRRLDLLYPQNHNLQIFDTGNSYSVHLEISIK